MIQTLHFTLSSHLMNYLCMYAFISSRDLNLQKALSHKDILLLFSSLWDLKKIKEQNVYGILLCFKENVS